MLAGAVRLLYRARRKAGYFGNLVWLAAKAQYRDFTAVPYSEYAEKVDRPTARRTSTVEPVAAVGRMLAIFLPKATEESDDA